MIEIQPHKLAASRVFLRGPWENHKMFFPVTLGPIKKNKLQKLASGIKSFAEGLVKANAGLPTQER